MLLPRFLNPAVFPCPPSCNGCLRIISTVICTSLTPLCSLFPPCRMFLGSHLFCPQISYAYISPGVFGNTRSLFRPKRGATRAVGMSNRNFWPHRTLHAQQSRFYNHKDIPSCAPFLKLAVLRSGRRKERTPLLLASWTGGRDGNRPSTILPPQLLQTFVSLKRG